MKSLLMSIRPRHCANILNRLKTREIRKRFPSNYRGWVYIYCTKDKELLHKNCANIYWLEDKDFRAKNKRLGIETQLYLNGKVIARFYCDNVEEILFDLCEKEWFTDTLEEKDLLKQSCLSQEDLDDYLQAKNGYAIHISQLEIFDTPKELSEFKNFGHIKRYCLDCDSCIHYSNSRCWVNYCCYRLKHLTKAPQSYMFIEVL